MKPFAAHSSLALLIGLLSACANNPPPSLSGDSQFAAWLDQQAFSQAAGWLSGLPSPSPQRDSWQKQLDDKIRLYEQKILQQGEAAANAEHWAEALKLYQQGLEKLPASQALQQAHQTLYKRQQEKLVHLRQEQLIAKGQWLAQSLAISELIGANPQTATGECPTNTPARQHEEALQVAVQLTQLAQTALARQDVDLAARAVPLAAQLAPETANPSLPAQLQTQLNAKAQSDLAKPATQPKTGLSPPTPTIAENTETKATVEPSPPRPPKTETEPQREQKKAQRLLADFKKALRGMDFAQARLLIPKLTKQGVDTAMVAKLSKQLDEQVAGQVRHLTALGIEFYSQQRYDEAMKAWKQAQSLEPSNEKLAAHIERAAKVLEKLQDLRNKNRN